MDNTPSSIICFKNGFSFVTVPVVLQEDSKNSDDPNVPIKECTIGPLPSFAVHGTVGLQADNPDCVRIFSLSKAPKKDDELLLPPGPDFSYHAFLKANLGTRVKIQTNNEKTGMQNAEGRVKWVKPGEDVPLMAILETSENNKKKDQLFDTSKVVHLERIDGLDQSSESSSLLVRYTSTGDSAPGSMLSYLTNGLTWAPSYTVLMDKKTKTVKLEGKACLLCDLPFLDGGAISEISLVTGKPNMEFQHISDPLASGVSASNFVAQLGRGRQVPLQYQSRGQMLQTNACFGFGGGVGGGPMAPMQEAEGIKGGESVEDFFHYILKNVPLKFNHPLSIPFIEECCNIGYEDIYYLDLDRVNTDGEEQSSVEVKHAITFKNTSGQPLTTAPATILAKTKDSNSKFMVQGMMKYTGPEKNATIEITRTMDVQGKFVIETMKERKTEVINESVEGTGLFGSGSKKLYADSIQKIAKVIIMNSKDVEIKCKVEYQLVGHLEDSSPEFKDKMERQRNQHIGLNPTTKYVWEVEIPASGKGEIDFKFCMKEWNHALNNKQ